MSTPTRRSARSYRTESAAPRPPYVLYLDNPKEGGPDHVEFLDINKIPVESTFALADGNPRVLLKAMLSEADYKLWWAEWRDMPADALGNLLDDIRQHFGADAGKAES